MGILLRTELIAAMLNNNIFEALIQNLWAMKTVLRIFELSSGLRVNFAKSSLMGVNVSEVFFGNGCQILAL